MNPWAGDHVSEGGQLPHWREAIERMELALASGRPMLIGLDFDGTLSAIVDRPADAVAVAGAAEVLADLASMHPAVRVAFLSGRALGDLAGRLPAALSRCAFAGNHGLEMRINGEHWEHPGVVNARPALRELTHNLHRTLCGLDGWELEDKGASVSLHHRRMEAHARMQLLTCVRHLQLKECLRIHHGKKVVEFRPRVDWHKGAALRRLIGHFGVPAENVVYVGDDATDEDAFLEVRGRGLTLRVGGGDSQTAAAYRAEDPHDVIAFLQWLAERLAYRK